MSNNARDKNQFDNDELEYKKLLCSIPGCGALWTVRIEQPMCSRHQWGDNLFKNKAKATKPPTDLKELLKMPPRPNFSDVDNEAGF
jgi:hypothetical protein